MIFQPENNIGESSRPVGLILCGNLSFLLQVAYVTSLGYLCSKPASLYAGGVRHDPQRFMGKTVALSHFNRDTIEFASRERYESNPGIKTLLPFLKSITEESDSGLRCLLLAS